MCGGRACRCGLSANLCHGLNSYHNRTVQLKRFMHMQCEYVFVTGRHHSHGTVQLLCNVTYGCSPRLVHVTGDVLLCMLIMTWGCWGGREGCLGACSTGDVNIRRATSTYSGSCLSQNAVKDVSMFYGSTM
jgi:hypothetical protein